MYTEIKQLSLSDTCLHKSPAPPLTCMCRLSSRHYLQSATATPTDSLLLHFFFSTFPKCAPFSCRLWKISRGSGDFPTGGGVDDKWTFAWFFCRARWGAARGNIRKFLIRADLISVDNLVGVRGFIKRPLIFTRGAPTNLVSRKCLLRTSTDQFHPFRESAARDFFFWCF